VWVVCVPGLAPAFLMSDVWGQGKPRLLLPTPKPEAPVCYWERGKFHAAELDYWARSYSR